MAQAIFGAMVKIASLKHRIFGPKDHPASPEARALLGVISSMSGMIWSPKRTIEQIAEQTEKYGRKVGPPKGTKITEIRTGDAHALWCELPGADVATCPVIIHFHGGGYVCGSCYSVQGDYFYWCYVTIFRIHSSGIPELPVYCCNCGLPSLPQVHPERRSGRWLCDLSTCLDGDED